MVDMYVKQSVTLVQRVWSWVAGSPRRLHEFVLAGQLGHGYQPNGC